MSHPNHDNCAQADACYQWGFGAGFRDAWEGSRPAPEAECATCSGRGVWMDEPCGDCRDGAR